MTVSNPHILCIEDDADTCELIQLMLKNSDDGYQVTTVSTPEMALPLIAEKLFDLYILDYKMPNMSGVEFCMKIRESDKQTPVMFFTAMASSCDREAAMAAGANAYLVKPRDLDRLTATVRRFVSAKTA